MDAEICIRYNIPKSINDNKKENVNSKVQDISRYTKQLF